MYVEFSDGFSFYLLKVVFVDDSKVEMNYLSRVCKISFVNVESGFVM